MLYHPTKKVCNVEKHIALPQILLEQQQAT